MEAFGTVDVLVNNAGLVSPMLHFFEADEAWWRRIIDVNLTGHFLCCHQAARIMATEGQRNYRAAKRKAADRIGVSSRLALPSNREVEEALRAYQEFYGGERHARQLEGLRDGQRVLDLQRYRSELR